MKKNILYLECNSGISGDMTVAALLDLGADRNVLEKALQSMPIDGFEINISRVKKAGLDVCDFQVILEKDYENHDHDMKYLFEEGHSHDECSHYTEHTHDGQCHVGEVDQYGQKHDHIHEHRNLQDILHIIDHTDMTEAAKETAARIFQILAAAEAKAHGIPEEEVHFHEVGAVDSIVDIVSAAVCLDNLGITECVVSPLCEGTGTIRCKHGILSVPVPAVLYIAQAHQLELSVTDSKGELVTPTGAAIAAAVKTADNLPKRFRILKTGMGAGKRTYERPSILRAMLIEETGLEDKKCQTETVKGDDDTVIRENDEDVIYKLESNIDDCSGESMGYVMDRLLEAGARDVHYTPVYMKKNRPAYQLNVICKEEQIAELESIIFMETTTIGIRRQKMKRTILSRRSMEVLTEWGNAVVKVCTLPDGKGERYYPEYESVAALSKMSGRPFAEVYRMIVETL